MICEDLVQLATRLAQGPVPTLQKKVYGYQGNINVLLDALPSTVTMQTRVTDACDRNMLPAQAERLTAYLSESLTAHIRELQARRQTSIIILREAVLLARYRMPLSLFYDLTGDAHALVLHLERGLHPQKWRFPAYVHYDSEAPTSYLERVLGGQFIRDELS
jgi:hypothetical protein